MINHCGSDVDELLCSTESWLIFPMLFSNEQLLKVIFLFSSSLVMSVNLLFLKLQFVNVISDDSSSKARVSINTPEPSELSQVIL